MNYRFQNSYISLNVSEKTGDVLEITGNVTTPTMYSKMVLFAANPIDRMTNYTGSGLAFPSNTIAFEGSPNYYEIDRSGVVKVSFIRPNSYYSTDTLTRIVPSIFVKLESGLSLPTIIHFKLEDTLSLKGINYRPERTGPYIYEKKADIIGVRSQYESLKMIAYAKINGKAS